MCAGGCLLSVIGGAILHLVSGTKILLMSCASTITAAMLFAHNPAHDDYWRMVLPAMLCATIAIDFAFTVANVHLSTSLPARQQGLAAGVSMALAHLSGAVLLAFAAVVETHDPRDPGSTMYQSVFWMEAGCGALAFLVIVLAVRVGPAVSEKRVEERVVQTPR